MRDQQRGFAILLALVVLVPLALLVQVPLVRSITELRGAQRTVQLDQAFQLAEAAVDEAYGALKTSPLATAWPSCVGPARPNLGTVSTVNCAVTDLGGGVRRITATGTVGPGASITQRIEVIAVVTTHQSFDRPISAQTKIGGFGSGGVIDNYDSSLGNYGDPLSPPNSIWGDMNKNYTDASGVVRGALSAIQTNGITTVSDAAGRAIAFSGSTPTKLYGDAIVGSSYTGAIADAVSPYLNVLGVGSLKRTALPSETLSFPTMTFPTPNPLAGVTYTNTNNCTLSTPPISLSVNGVLRIDHIGLWNGCAVEFTGQGDVHLNSLSSGDSARIRFLGGGQINVYVAQTVGLANGNKIELVDPGTKVAFYVQGKFSAGGSTLVNASNPVNKPSDFQLVVKYNSAYATQVSFGNSSQVYGTINAPQSTVDLNQGTALYGAIIANQVTGANSDRIHYDVSLHCAPSDATCGNQNSTVTFKSWRQCPPAGC